MNKQEIGERLRQLRQKAGYDAPYVCKSVGISISALSMYECGLRIPRDEIKQRLARLYNTTVDYLFFS